MGGRMGVGPHDQHGELRVPVARGPRGFSLLPSHHRSLGSGALPRRRHGLQARPSDGCRRGQGHDPGEVGCCRYCHVYHHGFCGSGLPRRHRRGAGGVRGVVHADPVRRWVLCVRVLGLEPGEEGADGAGGASLAEPHLRHRHGDGRGRAACGGRGGESTGYLARNDSLRSDVRTGLSVSNVQTATPDERPGGGRFGVCRVPQYGLFRGAVPRFQRRGAGARASGVLFHVQGDWGFCPRVLRLPLP
mmetsp:Transcript_39020/g.91091  ORF Transcript_39020/g.91091 Transcript_39020/m.91091 type:complete len:246 (+) Transcript_39020:307-1044(+)